MGKSPKIFWDARSKKLSKKKRRKFHYHNNLYKDKSRPKTNQQQYIPDYYIDVPGCFSFIINMEETTLFFKEMMDRLKKAMPKSDFLINLQNVSEVTTDAVMYLIALMRNHKESRKRLYSFHGNYPTNELARNTFIESGFLKFVNSRSRRLPEKSSKMSIVCGTNSDAVSAKQICLFVADKLEISTSYVKDLYEVIIEMMSNVYYHAYNGDEDTMLPEWYMYAEHIQDKVNFLFLDTGLGIGKTVQKHSLYEKVINKVGVGSESKLIKSALNGDFRTQTGEINRGKGLPSIKEYACKNKIESFHILSGRGHCWFENQSVVCHQELKYNLYGTIYIFTIKKVEEP